MTFDPNFGELNVFKGICAFFHSEVSPIYLFAHRQFAFVNFFIKYLFVFDINKEITFKKKNFKNAVS